MGLPDLAPESSGITNALKRTHSELQGSDLSSLCLPPHAKRSAASGVPACSHVSVLRDLESSLASFVSDDDSPEELITEMMKSLQSAIGDVSSLPLGSSCASRGPDRSVAEPRPHLGTEEGVCADGSSRADCSIGVSTDISMPTEPDNLRKYISVADHHGSESAVAAATISKDVIRCREDAMDPAINAKPSGSLQHFGSPREMTGLRMAAQDSGGREAETLTSYEVLSRANAQLEAEAGTDSEELETIRRLLDVSDDDLDSPNVRIGEWNDWLNEGYDAHCLPLSLFVDESS